MLAHGIAKLPMSRNVHPSIHLYTSKKKKNENEKTEKTKTTQSGQKQKFPRHGIWFTHKCLTLEVEAEFLNTISFDHRDNTPSHSKYCPTRLEPWMDFLLTCCLDVSSNSITYYLDPIATEILELGRKS